MGPTTLTSGDLAEAAGVGVETVRYYERRGLLAEPPRGKGGRRQYGSADLRRLRFIRRAKELGFQLEEIRELLELRVQRASSCAAVAEAADSVIQRVTGSITDLERIRDALEGLLVACRDGRTTDDCPILEALEPD